MLKGYPVIQIETQEAQATVNLFGGQVISYRPNGQDDVLWVSDTLKQPPIPIRGGIPVCWPYFSREGQADDVPFHGVARTTYWQMVNQENHPNGSVTIRLEAPQFEKYALRLSMELEIGGELKQRMVTHNTGDVPFPLTQALHTYFKVSNAANVSVRGVDGCRFVDKYEGARAVHQQRGDWTLFDAHNPGHSDRIYQDVRGNYVIVDEPARRSIHIHTDGSQSLVIWNPGEMGAANFDDIGPQWGNFVCVETVNAGADVILLAPGATHTLAQTVRLEPRDAGSAA